jgi:multidrug efflux pump subunit AcrA (membrane-fusion protein)
MNGSTSKGYFVAVALTENELAAVDTASAALVWPADAPEGEAGLSAMPFDKSLEVLPGGEEQQSAERVLYYALEGGASTMAPGAPVFIEVPLAGGGGPRLTVPYSALLYDLDGTAWVYVSPEPLSFQRHEVVVDRIEGDIAVLSSGPPVGTEVVKTGATELFGVESGVGGGH